MQANIDQSAAQSMRSWYPGDDRAWLASSAGGPHVLFPRRLVNECIAELRGQAEREGRVFRSGPADVVWWRLAVDHIGREGTRKRVQKWMRRIDLALAEEDYERL